MPAAARLLHNRRDWGVYGAAWLVFLSGFAALFWRQESVGAVAALRASAWVVLPAALLGIVAVRFCERTAARLSLNARRFVAHVLAALLFATLWIGTVNVLTNLRGYWSTGTLRWRLPPDHVVHWHYFTGLAIYLALAVATYARAHTLAEQRQRLLAEWRLLRGQLSPHFLFNTLHSIFALVQAEPTAGENALARLSRLLRHSLQAGRDGDDAVRLADEWAFTEDYLALEALRTDCLQWTADIPADAAWLYVPPFLLQPLVENAVRHAMGSDGCTITVKARATREELEIRVADDGRGAVAGEVARSPGVGLRATRARVSTLTDRPDAFVVQTAPGQGFAVTLRLPRHSPEPGIPARLADQPEAGLTPMACGRARLAR